MILPVVSAMISQNCPHNLKTATVGMVQTRPARGHLEGSHEILVVCRLPGFVTILAAINDEARHHSWQDPTC